MQFYSTRCADYTANAMEAVLKGIAPDGGLYTPLDFSGMQVKVSELLQMSAVEISTEVIGKILGDFSGEEMRKLIEASYAGKFETDDMTPLQKVGDDFRHCIHDFALELLQSCLDGLVNLNCHP